MDAQYYKDKVLDLLNDENYYTTVSNSNTKEIFNKIKGLINKNKNITKQEKEYLLDFDYKCSLFYGLPKIHKSGVIQAECNELNNEYIEILNPSDLPLRPIVAGPQCETSHLSFLLDILLKPFLTKVYSLVRDNVDFLSFMPKEVPEHTVMVTFDIVSLYSNIPHDLGIKAISFCLDKYPELILARFDKTFIIESLKSLKMILENNIFSFNGLFFKQAKGTAMGTKVAPTYAYLV